MLRAGDDVSLPLKEVVGLIKDSEEMSVLLALRKKLRTQQAQPCSGRGGKKQKSRHPTATSIADDGGKRT